MVLYFFADSGHVLFAMGRAKVYSQQLFRGQMLLFGHFVGHPSFGHFEHDVV